MNELQKFIDEQLFMPLKEQFTDTQADIKYNLNDYL